MSDVYSTPKSNPIETTPLELTFSSLGIWRKLYLALNWLVVVLFVFFALVGVLFGEEGGQLSIPVFALAAALVAYAIWTHTAIVNRRVTQLRIICFLQVIPFMNPVSAIIFWAISSTSKTEQQA